MKNSWTDDDFSQMSWHDNAVHGIRIIEGQYGSGEFVLDIDYILEWLPKQDHEGGLRFRIAPAELRFHETTDLKIALDYASATAALTPFSIHQIQFEPIEYENGIRSKRWRIEINWPVGEITFQSPRLTQALTGSAIVSDVQSLSDEQRAKLRGV